MATFSVWASSRIIPELPNGQVCNLILYGWAFGGDWYNADTGKITANDPRISKRSMGTLHLREVWRSEIKNFVASAGAT